MVPYFGDIPVKGVEGVQEDKEQPVELSTSTAQSCEAASHHSRKRPASLIPMDFGSVPRCSALKTMTGKAVEYFRAFARCCLHDSVSLDVTSNLQRVVCVPAPASVSVLTGIVPDPHVFY